MISLSSQSNRKHQSSSSFSSKVLPFLNMGCVSSKFLKKHAHVNDEDDDGGGAGDSNNRTAITHNSTLDLRDDKSFVSIGFQRHYVSLTSTSYGLLRVESPSKHKEKRIKKDVAEETLMEMYGKLSALDMDVTPRKPFQEEMDSVISPIERKLTSSHGKEDVRSSNGSPDYAISETIDVGDMMLGLEEAATLSECSTSPPPQACKRSSIHTLHPNPKKLGKKARYAEHSEVASSGNDDGGDDDEAIDKFDISQLQLRASQPLAEYPGRNRIQPLKRSAYFKEEACDSDENTIDEFRIPQSKLLSSRQPNHGPKHNKIVKKCNKMKKFVSEVIDEEGFGDENATPQQVQNSVKPMPSKNKSNLRSPLGSVPFKIRETSAVASNKFLGSPDSIVSMKLSPKGLSPMTRHHATMMLKYSTPSPKGMTGNPLSRSVSGSSTKVAMGPILTSREPNKSSSQVLMGSSLIYSPSSSPLFDPELVASYEEVLENLSWAENHKENELQMQEVEKELNEALCIYAPTSVHHMNMCDASMDFDVKCPPRGANRIVLYTTTLRGIRKTFEDCNDVRSILQGLDLIVDERDVSMHRGFLNELTVVMGRVVTVPRMFIKGRYIGGIEEVRKLHEEGMLNELVEGLPTDMNKQVCNGCGGVRFVPCLECNGSCKVRKGEESAYSRCPQCNENGLIQCPICI